MKKKVLNYRVIVEQDTDGIFVAQVPSLQGCYTQGDTYEEVMANIKEVIELHLKVRKGDVSGDDSSSEFVGIKNIQIPIQYGTLASI